MDEQYVKTREFFEAKSEVAAQLAALRNELVQLRADLSLIDVKAAQAQDWWKRLFGVVLTGVVGAVLKAAGVI